MNVWKPCIGTQDCPGQVKSHAGLVNLAAHLPDQASGKNCVVFVGKSKEMSKVSWLWTTYWRSATTNDGGQRIKPLGDRGRGSTMSTAWLPGASKMPRLACKSASPDQASGKKRIEHRYFPERMMEVAQEWAIALCSRLCWELHSLGTDQKWRRVKTWTCQRSWKQEVQLGGVRGCVKLQLCVEQFESEAGKIKLDNQL